MSAVAGRTVLVADDDEEVRTTLAEYLRAQAFEVLEAADGFDTLLKVKRARPGGVVLDLLMPRLGGLEALRQIRESAPETVVVVVTGADDPSLHAQAVAAGASAVLTKPPDLAELKRALSSAVAPRPATAGTPGPSRAASGAAKRAAGRVLIVDDDAGVADVLEELLTQHGYAARSVGDAAAAFWALMQDVPDVVLLDISMPGLSGVDLIPAIHLVSRDVKIIMVSGGTDVAIAKQALAYGAFDYVTKPVDMDYLVRSLETALSMKRLEAE